MLNSLLYSLSLFITNPVKILRWSMIFCVRVITVSLFIDDSELNDAYKLCSEISVELMYMYIRAMHIGKACGPDGQSAEH